MQNLRRGQNIASMLFILVFVGIATILVLPSITMGFQSGMCAFDTGISLPGETNLYKGHASSDCIDTNGISITYVEYDREANRLIINAVYDGEYSDDVTLNVSTGAEMVKEGDHYMIEINGLLGCPCKIAIKSSLGEREFLEIQ